MIEINSYTIRTIGEMVEQVLANYEDKLEAGEPISQEYMEALKVFAAKLENCSADLSMLSES